MRALALTLAAHLAASYPTFNVSNVLSSHAVLQRDKPVAVWGWSNASSSATITSSAWADGKSYAATADAATGLWRIVFPPAAATSAPFALSFNSSAGADDVVTLDDLLLGDVIFCSGQSNMGAVQIAAMWNVTDIVAAAANLPTLRIAQVAGNLQFAQPLNEWYADGLVPWQAPLGETGSNATLLGFSAVCFILGSTLYTEHLSQQVPIGLLHSSHGGTSIQAWLSPRGVNQCGDNSNSWNSSVMFNGNVHPATVGPLSLSSVYYYQAEQDCGLGPSESFWRAQWYGCSIRALIRDWRFHFADDSLFWVEQQLHAWLHGSAGADIGLATMRGAQMRALQEPLVALSTAFDGGDPAAAMAGSPGGTVHSHDKYVPGRRAALSLAGAYYNHSVAFRNPRYASAVAQGTSNGTHTALTVEVVLESGTVTGRGLVMRGWEPLSNSSHCPTERAVNASYCDWFAIQVNDAAGSWYNATAALTGDAQGVLLSAVVPGGSGVAVVATRNGWADWPVVTVYSAEGLPLAPWLRQLNA